MPRDGSGRSDNAVENPTEIIHGAGDTDTKVNRSHKAAPMPEPEKGVAIEGMNASGGGSQGLSKGPDAGHGGRGSKN